MHIFKPRSGEIYWLFKISVLRTLKRKPQIKFYKDYATN